MSILKFVRFEVLTAKLSQLHELLGGQRWMSMNEELGRMLKDSMETIREEFNKNMLRH
jgi:hypothetical protein